MKLFSRFLLATSSSTLCLCLMAVLSPIDLQAQVDFVKDVRPILSDKCFHCHGPDESTRETDLRFDIEASAKSDLGGYFAIVPGDLEQSEMVERLDSDDEYFQMPPADSHKKITPEQIAILKQWVKQGAPWSAHWAYVEPQPHETPTLDSDWPNNWIDHFVLKRLQEEELSPSNDAQPITLARRLYFDLTGLPPTPEEARPFVQGETSYEELVDRLLSRDQFGERMAVYWLDLVRFADTVGYHGDQDHSITPYRDWVIDAFNDNMSFDQFTIEQLAGDLLPEPTIDQQVATGYNRLLQTSHEGGVQPKEYIAIYAADRVRNVSQVWMGATVGCAQCHDHKYDPYSIKDFYALSAFFADIDDETHILKGTNSLPTARPPEIVVHSKREREELATLKKQREILLEKPDSDSAEARLKEVDQQIETLESAKRKTMITRPLEKPRVTRLLPRGNWLDESGEVLEPTVPEFMKQIRSDDRANRMDLANWLVDPVDGTGMLTARVFVNRIWGQLFGVGLCPSLDDFGGQGSPPVYPELLDRLAIEFVESGWDIKELVRLIVSSRAYQQSSSASAELRERDPNNHLFARQSSFRLPAEFIRDNALAVSGLLNSKIGGASAKPYQPVGYFQHLNFPKRKYQPHLDQRQYRRGLYVHWQRQFLHPMFYAFDAPRREECTAERAKSNTPSAALVLLNDPTFVESAKALAWKVFRATKDGEDEVDSARVTKLFNLVLSRDPDQHEMKLVISLLAENREAFEKDPAASSALLKTGLMPIEETSNASEMAALTMVARVVLNLSETNTRN